MKQWTKEEIKKMLQKSNKAVERGITAIYTRQLADERLSECTKYHNGVGFSAFDAKRASYYAKWIHSGKHLSGIHITKARKIAIKYAQQLTDMANQKEKNEVLVAKSLLKNGV